ncbi:ABC transporter ATP-binding protein [Cryobacterium sp. SO1]|uniref:ABC transporter ATP-binding protein n=1 Tax=Cryobacterium sp. SO1 TaxID=1897061 RepID=UPI00102374DF|nr:ABC transporter ATP-binding protein [Cryobacterium sp. SO1]RZI34854.1 Oligopeptide transport ATP-binding protein OppD [Cryobacterium sp. SO1]
MSTGLSISDLTLRIGSVDILRGISFDVPAGQITGLAGESGSGKTMTGMSVCGLQPADAQVGGSIRYDGRELVGLPERELNTLRGKEIAMIFQDPSASLHPMLTIGTQLTDHLRHHERIRKDEARVRAVEALGSLQVPDPESALKKYPHQFSGGQLQRIAIAGAIICNPQVLIADEPTTALDVTVQAEILRLIRQLCTERQLAVLLVTHDLGVMSALADRIVVMRRGKIVESGSRFDVITSPQQDYTRSLIDSLPNAQTWGAEKGADS